MKKSTENLDKEYIGTALYMIIAILKWCFFALCVVTSAFTIGLIVLALFKGTELSNEMVAKMFSYITFSNETKALELVKEFGIFATVVSTCIYGGALALSYGIQYNIINKAQEIFVSILTGNMYRKENVDIIKKLFPSAIILAFTQPVVVSTISSTVGIFSDSMINVSGLFYVFALFVFKMIFEKGYELTKKNARAEIQLSDYKAKEAEYQMEVLKQEAEIKSLKKEVKNKAKEIELPKEKKVKKTTTKKTTKKTTDK